MSLTLTVCIAAGAGTRKWSGSGSKQTESFETTTREWRIEWDSPSDGFIGILVFNDADELVATATSAEPHGTSYVRSRPGIHYMKINSTKSWKVTIEAVKDLAEDAPSEGTWLHVTSFSASSEIKRTPTFKISSSPWRIVWAAPSSEKQHIGIEVHNEAGTIVQLAVNAVDENNGTAYIRSAPGQYYLRVNTRKRWELAIEEKAR